VGLTLAAVRAMVVAWAWIGFESALAEEPPSLAADLAAHKLPVKSKFVLRED